MLFVKNENKLKEAGIGPHFKEIKNWDLEGGLHIGIFCHSLTERLPTSILANQKISCNDEEEEDDDLWRSFSIWKDEAKKKAAEAKKKVWAF